MWLLSMLLSQAQHSRIKIWYTLTNLHLDKMATILAGEIYKCVFLHENVSMSIKVRMINNPALVQIMARWRIVIIWTQ